jgi:hypothetical protein
MCAAIFLAASTPAWAAPEIEGIVAQASAQCRNRFAILTEGSYTILVWNGGAEPRIGARALGTLGKYGPTYITIDGRRSNVFISDYGVSSATYASRLRESC